MALESLDHYLVYASDLPASRAFYRDVLGLEEGPRPAFGFPGYWFYLDGRAVVHLAGDDETGRYEGYIGARPPLVDHTGAVDHIAFRGGDFAGFRSRLDEMGIRYKHNSVPDFKIEQLFVHDPDGVTIELNFLT